MPWITRDIKKLIHKRDKLYHKLKSKHSSPNTNNKFKSLKHQIKAKIKNAHTQYLSNILGTASTENPDVGTPNKCDTKKLFSLIKNSKQDSQSVSPLKDPVSGILKTNKHDKASTLNNQFQSVFTPKSPLSLKQNCLQKLKNLYPSSYCKHPQMPYIQIDRDGLLKLFLNLKPDKAAGPDRFKPVILKELKKKLLM